MLAVRRGGELDRARGRARRAAGARRAGRARGRELGRRRGGATARRRPRRKREPAAADIGDRLRGAAASPGIALGPARRLETVEPEVAEAPSGSPAEERARLAAARDAVREDLVAAGRALSGPEAEIFDAHRMLLDDAALVTPAEQRIADGAAAGAAWRDAAREAAAAFRALDDAYLRERAVDVEDVARRVLARLAGVRGGALLREPGHRARRRAHAGRGRGARPRARASGSSPRAAAPPGTPRSSPARSGSPR